MQRALDARLVSGALLALALVLGAMLLRAPLEALSAAGAASFQRLILMNATLPRLAMAILCGAALAMSGAILQQVLRNPMVAPDTLAVSAGARLALGLAMLLAPGLLGFGRDLVAIAGAIASTALVMAVSRSRKYSPLSMILAGLVVSLYCGALSIILVLLKDRYLVGLFIWGSGSLSQQSWAPALQLGLRLLVCALPLYLLLRPLSVLDAGEEVARNVGVRVERVRFIAIGLAVLMAAFVTSAVGVIGFIGLAAPALATLCGVQRFTARLLWSGALGALLLLVTDLAVQLIAGESAAFIPTGAVTAVIGSPVLLILLSRLRASQPQSITGTLATSPRPILKDPFSRAALIIGAIAGVALLLFIGRGADGSWQILNVATLDAIMPWRLPRLLGVAGAGALLATGGYLLQRVTQNPLASPEIMGVSAGAILGAAAALTLSNTAGAIGLSAASAIGSLAALIFVLSISLHRSAAPERMLLTGVALTALVDAIVGLIIASGSPSSVLLLSWLAGSSSSITMSMAIAAAVAAIIVLAVALLTTRWLGILPLGAPLASAVGVQVPRAQGAVFILVALTAAIATPVIGPLTFVGLMAPHLVRLLNIRDPRAGLIVSAFTGAALLMLADTLARTIAFPMQLPTGVLASLLVSPILLILIATGAKR